MRKYLWLTLKHKWFVMVAGNRIGISFDRLLLHDWSKLLPRNLKAYERQFFGDKSEPEEFVQCWLRHQNLHDHHWEYWVPRTGHSKCKPPYPDNRPLPMSQEAAYEMVADWLGASRAYEGKWPESIETWPWIQENWHKINVHPDTRRHIRRALSKYGINAYGLD